MRRCDLEAGLTGGGDDDLGDALVGDFKGKGVTYALCLWRPR